MANSLTMWECKLKSIPDTLVKVAYHNEATCGIVFIEPTTMKGRRAEVQESDLVPLRRPHTIKPTGPTLEDATVEELRAKLSSLHSISLRPAQVKSPSAKRGRSKKKDEPASELSNLIDKLSPAAREKLEKALNAGVSMDLIKDILKGK